jgi:hypothetical protein
MACAIIRRLSQKTAAPNQYHHQDRCRAAKMIQQNVQKTGKSVDRAANDMI